MDATSWKFNDTQPIYLQLISLIQNRIASGLYPPGSRLDSVRDLASQAGVNPNTMQKALTELERMGLVHSQRTSGRYITQDAQQIQELRRRLADSRTVSYLEDMRRLGYDCLQTLDFLKATVLHEDSERKEDDYE